MSTEILARLTNMEQAIHRDGWDQPPTLHLMYHCGSERATVVPNPPGAALAFLAQQMATHADDSDLRSRLVRTAERGAVAVVFACEVWINDEFVSDEERAADRRDLADIPGTKEARLVSAVGMDGTHYLVNRVRGQKPQTETYGPDDAGCPEGRIYKALAQIADVIRTAAPTPGAAS